MERLLSPEDLASILQVSVKTIYNRRSNGSSLPPALNLGGQVRYRQADVQAWLDARYELEESSRVAAPCGINSCIARAAHDERSHRRGRAH